MHLKRSVGLSLLDRAADYVYSHNHPGVNHAGQGTAVRSVSVKQLEQHSKRRICEVDEARLCGSSLPVGPIALPALGRRRPGLENPACL